MTMELEMTSLPEGGFGLTAPKHETSLASAAVLVSVTVSLWSATATDKKVSDEVSSAKSAQKNAGRYSKQLLPDNKDFALLVQLRQEITKWVDTHTFEWMGKLRLLPVARFPQFMADYAVKKARFDTLVDNFCLAYRSEVSTVAFKLGGLFRIEDYPSEAVVRQKFSMNLYTSEVPTGDFRVAVADTIREDLTQHFTIQHEGIMEDLKSQQREALTDYLTRLLKGCKLEATTAADGEVEMKRGRLHETTLQGALDLATKMIELGVADAKLLDAADRVRVLLARYASDNVSEGEVFEKLRKSDSIRHVIGEEVEDILSRL
jgi:hypothetical protein